ncbi:MAG: amino acid permease [Leptospirales bacterium]
MNLGDLKHLLSSPKHPSRYLDQSHLEHLRLKRSLGRMDLTLLGIGGVIGIGVFVLTGIAASRYAGPSVTLSFLLGGMIATLAALIYAEFASSVPITGSAYAYVSLAFGEIPAFLTGWALILTYALGAVAVSIGWAGYVKSLFEGLGVPYLTETLTRNPFDGGTVNLPAGVILVLILGLLMIGTRKSSSFNNIMVAFKVGIIVLFLILGSQHIQPSNWHPFFLNGGWGVLSGTMTIFFSYVGFDAVTTASEEAHNPQKDIPFGIIASLGLSTLLYMAVAFVLTGMVPSLSLNNPAPVARALLDVGVRFGETLVTLGALVGLTSVLLVLLFAQSRILVMMARDGLMPPFMSRVHPKWRTPVPTLALLMIFVSVPAMLFPIGTLARLTSAGTLFSFILVALSLLRFRRIHPPVPGAFRCPWVPAIPLFSIVLDLILIGSVPRSTILLLVGWLMAGLLFYALGRKTRFLPAAEENTEIQS